MKSRSRFAWLRVLGLVWVAFLVSCNGGERRQPSLPLSVVVFYEGTRADGEAADASAPQDDAQTRERGEILASAAQSALSVTRAVYLAGATREEALQAARNSEYLVAIRLEETAQPTLGKISAGWATLEVISWLFGGIPSWFVPTREYPSAARVDFEITDMNAVDQEGFEGAVRSDPQSLSLWQRSDILETPLDYAFSIIIPPMVVPESDSSRVESALKEEATADLKEHLGGRLFAALNAMDLNRGVAVEFRSPATGSVVSTPSLTFGFDIVAKKPQVLRNLDVYRISDQGALFRSQPTRSDIEGWNDTLGAEGRVRCQLSDPLPLEVGDNLIKVRILFSDGTRLTRTSVVSFRDEGEE